MMDTLTTDATALAPPAPFSFSLVCTIWVALSLQNNLKPEEKKTETYGPYLFSPVANEFICHILLPQLPPFHPIEQIRVISVIISPLHPFHLFARSLCSSALQGEGGYFSPAYTLGFSGYGSQLPPGQWPHPLVRVSGCIRYRLRGHPAPCPEATGANRCFLFCQTPRFR